MDAIDSLETGESPPFHPRCVTILFCYEFDVIDVRFSC